MWINFDIILKLQKRVKLIVLNFDLRKMSIKEVLIS